ncbi:MAG TPA: hypothetical protein VJ227_01680 [Patescibacteria group bacterium]|nr:hypothetical protein [Patescibacteria group bacterium]
MKNERETGSHPGLLDRLTGVASEVSGIREKNGGLLPKDLWLKVVEIAGSHFCLEVLLITPEGKPVLKVRHDPSAQGRELEWEGMLHLPGTALSPSASGENMVKNLIEREVVKEGEEEFAESLAQEAVFFGFARYPEVQRNTVADVLIMALVIDPKDKRFREDLVVFEKEVGAVIIDHHKPVIKAYYENPKGGVFIDTREQPNE